MKFGTILAAAAAMTMTAAPAVAASGNPAASLSVAQSVRTASPAANKSDLAGGYIFPIVGLLIVIAIIVVIEDKEDSP